MAAFKEYEQYDGLGLGELVRKGEVSAAELLEAAIERVEQRNPQINAVVHTFYERARQQQAEGLADGPFMGVPFLLKDLINACAGEPVTMGSRGIRWMPAQDTTLVSRYRSSGVNIFGKTNTPEFGLIITTEPKAHGPTHNPHKPGYSAGGSSGGSAAAVASGMVPLASGGDGGGSIRFPSAWCGVFGMKPSRGRNPIGPDHAEGWSGAVSEGVISRSVRDSAAMLDITAGPEAGAPYNIAPPRGRFLDAVAREPGQLRIALSKKPLVPTTVDPEVLAALEQTARQLEAMGHIVEEVEPAIDTNKLWKAFFVVVCAHTAALAQNVRRDFGKRAAQLLEPSTKNLAMLGRSLSAADMVHAKEEWHRISLAMGRLHESHDVMLCPTVPTPAVKHGVLPPKPWEEVLMTLSSHVNIGKLLFALHMVEPMALPVLEKMSFTILGNVTGLPGMSVPLHTSSQGLPIGMQFMGRMGDEETLYSLAGQLERQGLFTC